jgi:hypothetical protein
MIDTRQQLHSITRNPQRLLNAVVANNLVDICFFLSGLAKQIKTYLL